MSGPHPNPAGHTPLRHCLSPVPEQDAAPPAEKHSPHPTTLADRIRAEMRRERAPPMDPGLPQQGRQPMVLGYSQPCLAHLRGTRALMVPVPTRSRLRCPVCPAGHQGGKRALGVFSAWPDMKKHMGRYHRSPRVRFVCRHCQQCFDGLKRANLHVDSCPHRRDLSPSDSSDEDSSEGEDGGSETDVDPTSSPQPEVRRTPHLPHRPGLTRTLDAPEQPPRTRLRAGAEPWYPPATTPPLACAPASPPTAHHSRGAAGHLPPTQHETPLSSAEPPAQWSYQRARPETVALDHPAPSTPPMLFKRRNTHLTPPENRRPPAPPSAAKEDGTPDTARTVTEHADPTSPDRARPSPPVSQDLPGPPQVVHAVMVHHPQPVTAGGTADARERPELCVPPPQRRPVRGGSGAAAAGLDDILPCPPTLPVAARPFPTSRPAHQGRLLDGPLPTYTRCGKKSSARVSLAARLAASNLTTHPTPTVPSSPTPLPAVIVHVVPSEAPRLPPTEPYEPLPPTRWHPRLTVGRRGRRPPRRNGPHSRGDRDLGGYLSPDTQQQAGTPAASPESPARDRAQPREHALAARPPTTQPPVNDRTPGATAPPNPTARRRRGPRRGGAPQPRSLGDATAGVMQPQPQDHRQPTQPDLDQGQPQRRGGRPRGNGRARRGRQPPLADRQQSQGGNPPPPAGEFNPEPPGDPHGDDNAPNRAPRHPRRPTRGVGRDAPEPTAFQQLWLAGIAGAAERWDALENLCGDLATAVYDETVPRGENGDAHVAQPGAGAGNGPPQEHPGRGRARRGRGRRQPVRDEAFHRRVTPGAGFDPEEASALQRLYRENPKKAMQWVLAGDSPYCRIPGDRLQDHFRAVFANEVYAVGPTPPGAELRVPDPTEEDIEGLQRPITAVEIGARLSRMGNTAPGLDGVRYRHLRNADPGCLVMEALFAALQPHARVPQLWKDSVTVLVHKDGDRDDPANWRPIALSPTLAKLYLGVLADRLGKWAARTGRISRQQKGFQEFEGCLEHNFILQAAIDDSRQRRRQLAVAWLDLENAFGSIPHPYLDHILLTMGVPAVLRHTIADLYTGGSTRMRTPAVHTEPIPIEAGVRQGCPLSPVLFNLGMEPLIRSRARQAENRGYQLAGQHHSVLAYADDLAVLARGPQDLQALSDTATRVARWAGLKFKPRKCASLHLRERGGRPTIHVDETPIRALAEGEGYRHLGVPTGYRAAQTPEEDIQRLRADIARIDQSLLAPWQKIDATRVFLLSRMQFILRGGRVRKTALAAFDRDVWALVKRWLNLPHRATPLMAHVARTDGGAGILPLGDLCDTHSIAHAFRILSYKDPDISELAWTQLRAADAHKAGWAATDVTPELLVDYLNGSTAAPLNRDPGAAESFWTFTRNAGRRLRDSFGVMWWCSRTFQELQLDIPMPGGREPAYVRVGPQQRHQVSMRLGDAAKRHYRESVRRLPDQGKVLDASCRDPVSSHYMPTCKYTRFAEWCFVHRARLNVVPLNGAQRGRGQNDRRCRRCGYQTETLAHILNHCRVHSAAWQRRHNAVVERLQRAAQLDPGTQLRVNQQVPHTTSLLRPDLVLLNETRRTALLVDVTVPFDNRYVALEWARREKVLKYQVVLDQLRMRGFQADVEAIVVGSLGSWDPANDKVLRRLRIGWRYSHPHALADSERLRAVVT
ncbi:hypothetical protein PR048_033774 [Dryococelus australis]|uniref:Reverse transcriptase domain-containing protein n=1 Tax=Dryococelus australis TaxID=614101 RepID=A0ABQ9G1U0_9NEOP|nr:hypothetical protein PR048_033774 [Dryococelus australis]